MTGHGETGTGADVHQMVLERVSTMTIVLSGGCDLDPGAQRLAVGSGVLQEALRLQLLIARESFVEFGEGSRTLLDAVRLSFLHRIGEAGRRDEVFVRGDALLICNKQTTDTKWLRVSKNSVNNVCCLLFKIKSPVFIAFKQL